MVKFFLKYLHFDAQIIILSISRRKVKKKKSEGKSDLIPNPFVSLLFEFLFRENKGIGTSV